MHNLHSHRTGPNYRPYVPDCVSCLTADSSPTTGVSASDVFRRSASRMVLRHMSSLAAIRPQCRPLATEHQTRPTHASGSHELMLFLNNTRSRSGRVVDWDGPLRAGVASPENPSALQYRFLDVVVVISAGSCYIAVEANPKVGLDYVDNKADPPHAQIIAKTDRSSSERPLAAPAREVTWDTFGEGKSRFRRDRGFRQSEWPWRGGESLSE